MKASGVNYFTGYTNKITERQRRRAFKLSLKYL